MADLDNVNIPNNDQDRKNLQKSLDEIVNSMTRQDAERSFQNETLKELEDQYEIPKKVLRQVAKARQKDEYNEKSAEMDTFETLYEVLYESNNKEE